MVLARSAILGLLGLAAASTQGGVLAEPFVPADDGVILERLPPVDPKLKHELRLMRRALEADPGHPGLALSLALAYARLGRAEGDPRYDGYAQAALAPWWDEPGPPLPVLMLRATLKQRRHEFSAALADLDRLLARAPADTQALLTKATILSVQGRPEAALETCELLPGDRELIRAACVAGAIGRGGRAREADRLLADALAGAGEVDPEVRIFALTIQAELAAQLGDAAQAEARFREALDLEVRDPYLLGAFADFLLDEDRAAEVPGLLGEVTRIDPLLLRLALAERRLGHPQLGEHVRRLGDRFEAEVRRGDTVHLREAARFALHLIDRPREALEVALANFGTQREPVDARLVLEAAHAAGRPEAAAPVLAWLRQTGLGDARIEALMTSLQEGVRCGRRSSPRPY
jgi:tetratricopeptide (TPR) repeat protein